MSGGTPRPGGSIVFAYDAALRRRTATFSGVLGDDELVSAYRQLVESPDYDFAADDLADLRGVTRLDVTSAGLGRLMALFAGIDQLGVRTRLAIVAPGDEVFGVARMYQSLRSDDAPEEIAVFREIATAIAWLDRGPVV